MTVYLFAIVLLAREELATQTPNVSFALHYIASQQTNYYSQMCTFENELQYPDVAAVIFWERSCGGFMCI